jgi:nicotinate-nucleotide adenylyltransferase
MKIGVFPGSFNPVHIGHLAVANYIVEYEEYDEIWFLITPKNPLKKKNDFLNQELRLELIEKSIQGYDKFKICTIEWNMPQPTYTINTLQKLRMTYPQNNFELIIGADNWGTIHRWKDYQIILKNFRVLIYPRRGSERIYFNHPNVSLIEKAPLIEISSSVIRYALKKGRDMRFYMPTGTFERVKETDFFNCDTDETTEIQE